MDNPFEIILDKLESIENKLLQMKPETKIVETENKILTLKKLCEYVDMSPSAIYKRTSERSIPHYKLGKKVYFKKEEIEEWITTNKVKTRREIENSAMNFKRKRKK
jgi:excisionase family DNA binding protein